MHVTSTGGTRTEVKCCTGRRLDGIGTWIDTTGDSSRARTTTLAWVTSDRRELSAIPSALGAFRAAKPGPNDCAFCSSGEWILPGQFDPVFCHPPTQGSVPRLQYNNARTLSTSATFPGDKCTLSAPVTGNFVPGRLYPGLPPNGTGMSPSQYHRELSAIPSAPRAFGAANQASITALRWGFTLLRSQQRQKKTKRNTGSQRIQGNQLEIGPWYSSPVLGNYKGRAEKLPPSRPKSPVGRLGVNLWYLQRKRRSQEGLVEARIRTPVEGLVEARIRTPEGLVEARIRYPRRKAW
ncbi:hypothetical protein Bbelb_097590 [Branchiostoma belcheri]|nr:hypothetical protein Bbelb_097590 [Branchiostoma belcheri]